MIEDKRSKNQKILDEDLPAGINDHSGDCAPNAIQKRLKLLADRYVASAYGMEFDIEMVKKGYKLGCMPDEENKDE